MAAPDLSGSSLGDTFSGMFEGFGSALGDIGGIAGALGAGGPQAMTNFVNKIAEKQNMEIARKWDGFQKGQERTFTMIRDSAQRRHEMAMLHEKHSLEKGKANQEAIYKTNAALQNDPTGRLRGQLVGGLPPELQQEAGTLTDWGLSGLVVRSGGGLGLITQAQAGVESVAVQTNYLAEELGVPIEPEATNTEINDQYLMWQRDAVGWVNAMDGIGRDVTALLGLIEVESKLEPSKLFRSAQGKLEQLTGLQNRLIELNKNSDSYATLSVSPKYSDKSLKLQSDIDGARKLLELSEDYGATAHSASTLKESIVSGQLNTWEPFTPGSVMADPEKFHDLMEMPEVVDLRAGFDNLEKLINSLDPAALKEIYGDKFAGSPVQKLLDLWTKRKRGPDNQPVTFDTRNIFQEMQRLATDPQASPEEFKIWENGLKALSKLNDRDWAVRIAQRENKINQVAQAQQHFRTLLPHEMKARWGQDPFGAFGLDIDEVMRLSLSDEHETVGNALEGRGLTDHSGFDTSQEISLPGYDPSKAYLLPSVVDATAKVYLTPLFEGMTRAQGLNQANKLAQLMGSKGIATNFQDSDFRQAVLTRIGQLNKEFNGLVPARSDAGRVEEVINWGGRPAGLDEVEGFSSDPNLGDNIIRDSSTGRAVDETDNTWLGAIAQRAGSKPAGEEAAIKAEGGTINLSDLKNFFGEVAGHDWVTLVEGKFRHRDKPIGSLFAPIIETTMLWGTEADRALKIPGEKRLSEGGLAGTGIGWAGDKPPYHTLESDALRKKVEGRLATIDAMRNYDFSQQPDPVLRRKGQVVQDALRKIPDDELVRRLVAYGGLMSELGFSHEELFPKGLVPQTPANIKPPEARFDSSIPTIETVRGWRDEATAALSSLPNVFATYEGRMIDAAPGLEVSPEIMDKTVLDAMRVELSKTVADSEELLAAMENPEMGASIVGVLQQCILGDTGKDYATTATKLSERVEAALNSVNIGGGGLASDQPNLVKGVVDKVSAQENLPDAMNVLAEELVKLTNLAFTKLGTAGHVEKAAQSPQVKYIQRLIGTFMSDLEATAASEQLAFHKSWEAPPELQAFLTSEYDEYAKDPDNAYKRAAILIAARGKVSQNQILLGRPR